MGIASQIGRIAINGAATHLLNSFSDKQVGGAAASAIRALTKANELVVSATGGQHNVLSVAAATIKAHGDKFSGLVETLGKHYDALSAGLQQHAPGVHAAVTGVAGKLKNIVSGGDTATVAESGVKPAGAQTTPGRA